MVRLFAPNRTAVTEDELAGGCTGCRRFLAPTLHPSAGASCLPLRQFQADPAADGRPAQSGCRHRAALAKQAPDVADQLAAHADMIADLAAADPRAGDPRAADPPAGGVVAAYLLFLGLSPLPLVAALNARGVVTAMPVTPEPETRLPLSMGTGRSAC